MATALECGNRVLSYGEVDSEANRMARYLRSLGVGCGSFVGISLDRSEWPIVTILAVLKAGAAYVPIEPSLPDDRLRYIATRQALAVIVTESAYEARIGEPLQRADRNHRALPRVGVCVHGQPSAPERDTG